MSYTDCGYSGFSGINYHHQPIKFMPLNPLQPVCVTQTKLRHNVQIIF